MLEKMKGLLLEEEGQGTTEYGILVVGVIVVVGVVLLSLKTQLKGVFDGIAAAIEAAKPTP